MVLDVREEQTERGEQAGRRRHHDAAHLELSRHARGEDRPVPAEREQGVLARVAPALARDRPDGAHHVRRGNDVRAIRRLRQRQPHPARDLRLEDFVRTRGVQLHGPAGELMRIEEAEDHVRVRHRRLGTAEVVAERAGQRARALRADLKCAPRIDPHEGAPAGTGWGTYRLDYVARPDGTGPTDS